MIWGEGDWERYEWAVEKEGELEKRVYEKRRLELEIKMEQVRAIVKYRKSAVSH